MDGASESPLLVHTDPNLEGLADRRAWKGCGGLKRGELSETKNLFSWGARTWHHFLPPLQTPSQWVLPGHPRARNLRVRVCVRRSSLAALSLFGSQRRVTARGTSKGTMWVSGGGAAPSRTAGRELPNESG